MSDTEALWVSWMKLGWSPKDVDLLRAHAGAMGIEVPLPTGRPPRQQQGLLALAENPQPEKKGPSVAKNLINHVVFVLDSSSSMDHLTHEVVKVVDNQIAHLAQRSKEMGQETRVILYVFSSKARCVEEVFDMDVLRFPSIAEFYRPGGSTALIDATLLSLDDLELISEKYGDHAFLVYVVTDGEENASGRGTHSYQTYYRTPPELVSTLASRLGSLPGNCTVACLVPNQSGAFEAKRFGFPAGNVAVWDATSAKGMREAGETIRRATDSYMAARATGTRSTTNLFDIGGGVVNAQAILDAGLSPLGYDEYDLVPIPPLKGLVKPADYDEKKRRKPWKVHGGRIDEFVQNVRGGQYIAGQAYYQLVEGKVERIQASKKIAVVDKDTERVYTGDGARQLLGLTSGREERVKPTGSEKYLVYVQSKSSSRLLVVGTKLLILNK